MFMVSTTSCCSLRWRRQTLCLPQSQVPYERVEKVATNQFGANCIARWPTSLALCLCSHPGPIFFAGFVVGAMEQKQVWAIWCPLGDDCSKKRKQLAKATDQDTVRHKLLEHLMNSPYHNMEKEEAERMVAEAETQTWQEVVNPEEEPKPKKKRKREEEDEAPSGASGGQVAAAAQQPTTPPYGEGAYPAPLVFTNKAKQELASDVAKQVMSQLQQLNSSTSSSSGGPASVGGGVGGQLAVLAKEARKAVLPGLSLSHEEANMVCEALARAEHATRQAHRISTAAAAAFSQEANCIAECLANIKARMQGQ